MFVGHYGLALAAKRVEPGMNLGAAFLACQLLDLVWPALVILGIERVRVDPGATAFTPLDFAHYPWSHSLLLTVAWSLLAFVGARLLGRGQRESVVLAGLVLSHWVLDLLTHRPDLPLFPGGAKVGLQLWDSVPGTLVVELALFGGGLVLYLRTVGGPARRIWFWALMGFLTLVYLWNAFGPRPPLDAPAAALAGPALAMWLLVLWAWWADRPRPAATA